MAPSGPATGAASPDPRRCCAAALSPPARAGRAAGVPISAVAYGFLALVGLLQDWVFRICPRRSGLAAAPCGGRSRRCCSPCLLVDAGSVSCPGAVAIRPPTASTQAVPHRLRALPGILAALAGLSMGAVSGRRPR